MTMLYYFVDPMCSWCYGFSSELKRVITNLPEDMELRYVMGGLAPDSDEPLPPEMQKFIQEHWHHVAVRTGAKINFEFWEKCTPRRATYPSCRAVIAAGLQGQDKIPIMLDAIQRAYYQQVRNPSEKQTLVEVAGEIGLDAERFRSDLDSAKVEEMLQVHFEFKDGLGIQGFPTLAIEKDGKYYGLAIGYDKADSVLSRLRRVIEQSAHA